MILMQPWMISGIWKIRIGIWVLDSVLKMMSLLKCLSFLSFTIYFLDWYEWFMEMELRFIYKLYSELHDGYFLWNLKALLINPYLLQSEWISIQGRYRFFFGSLVIVVLIQHISPKTNAFSFFLTFMWIMCKANLETHCHLFGSCTSLYDIGILFWAVLVGIWLCYVQDLFPLIVWGIHLKEMQKLYGLPLTVHSFGLYGVKEWKDLYSIIFWGLHGFSFI